MKRKILVVLFFLVVFALPIAWYLFLQAFGENRFDLPKIERWDPACGALNRAAVVIEGASFDEWPNQLKRIQNRLKGQEVIELQMITSECSDEYDLYLVDKEGWVRGEFVVSREEVDRLMTEIDIYLLNLQNE